MRCVPRCGAERPVLGVPSRGIVDGLERRGILVEDMVTVPALPRPLTGSFFPPAEGIHTNPRFRVLSSPPCPAQRGGVNDREDRRTRPCPTSWIRQVVSSARKPSTSSSP